MPEHIAPISFWNSHIRYVTQVEHFGHMQCNCSMGVFPEVERAWLTIDSDIYVWKYEDGGDLAYYDGLTGINANERVSKNPHKKYVRWGGNPFPGQSLTIFEYFNMLIP